MTPKFIIILLAGATVVIVAALFLMNGSMQSKSDSFSAITIDSIFYPFDFFGDARGSLRNSPVSADTCSNTEYDWCAAGVTYEFGGCNGRNYEGTYPFRNGHDCIGNAFSKCYPNGCPSSQPAPTQPLKVSLIPIGSPECGSLYRTQDFMVSIAGGKSPYRPVSTGTIIKLRAFSSERNAYGVSDSVGNAASGDYYINCPIPISQGPLCGGIPGVNYIVAPRCKLGQECCDNGRCIDPSKGETCIIGIPSLIDPVQERCGKSLCEIGEKCCDAKIDACSIKGGLCPSFIPPSLPMCVYGSSCINDFMCSLTPATPNCVGFSITPAVKGRCQNTKVDLCTPPFASCVIAPAPYDFCTIYNPCEDYLGNPMHCDFGPIQIGPTGQCVSALCPVRKCLSSSTIITTPTGETPVTDLKIGMLVWTVDAEGNRIVRPLIKVSHVPALNHRVAHLVLLDGRSLDVSAPHPTADGRTVGDLHAGDAYDNSIVVSTYIKPYEGTATYDILPAGPTGYYYANGILMGSTLR